MTQSQINVRVDSSTKKDAERICSEIGISLSSAINIYLKKIVRENKIPFELEVDPFYSPKNLKKIEKLIEDYEKGKVEIVNHELIEEWFEKHRVDSACVGGIPFLAEEK